MSSLKMKAYLHSEHVTLHGGVEWWRHAAECAVVLSRDSRKTDRLEELHHPDLRDDGWKRGHETMSRLKVLAPNLNFSRKPGKLGRLKAEGGSKLKKTIGKHLECIFGTALSKGWHRCATYRGVSSTSAPAVLMITTAIQRQFERCWTLVQDSISLRAHFPAKTKQIYRLATLSHPSLNKGTARMAS